MELKTKVSEGFLPETNEESALVLTEDGSFEFNGKSLKYSKEGGAYIEGFFKVLLDDFHELLLSDLIYGGQKDGNEFVDFIGRSSQSQVGLDIKSDLSEIEYNEKDRALSFPVKLMSYQKNFELIPAIYRAIDSGELPIGCLAIKKHSEPLKKDVVSYLMSNGLIQVPDGTEILDDGKLLIPIDPSWELILSDSVASDQSDLVDLLQNGRQKLKKYQDQKPFNVSDKFKKGEFLVTGAKFSMGPYSILIKGVYLNGEEIKEITHLPAKYLGKGRTNGNILQEFEMYNSGKTVDKRNLSICVEIFPPDKTTQKLFEDMSGAEYKNVLNDGLDFSNVLKMQNSYVLGRLMGDLSPDPRVHAGGAIAKVLSAKGVLSVPHDRTRKFELNRIEKALKSSEEGFVGSLEEEISLMNNLKHKGKLLLSEYLIEPEKLLSLADTTTLGGIVFKRVNPNADNRFVVNPELLKRHGNAYLSGKVHEALMHLNQSKFFVGWDYEGLNNEKKYFEFSDGFWMSPEYKDKWRKVDCILAMFGSAVNEVEEVVVEKSSEALQKIINFLGAERVGLIHGKGPGVMKAADVVARKSGATSIGVGIGLEQVGEAPNMEPQVHLDFNSEERLYRAEKNDVLSTFGRWFNLGGSGTFEEFGISVCNAKLFEVIPAPLPIIDMEGGYSKSWKESISNMAGKEMIQLGDVKYMLGRPILAGWVDDLVTYHEGENSYDSAANEMIEFMSNPVAWWTKVGVPRDKIMYAVENHNKKLASYGKSLPVELERAAQVYADGEISSNVSMQLEA